MPSFDIVSKTDMAEVDNAVQGVAREIGTRFDFKGSKCTVERKDALITILADDDMKLRHPEYAAGLDAARRPAHALEAELCEAAGLQPDDVVERLRTAWQAGA